MLDGKCPTAKLTAVVEPWFMGGGKEGPGGQEFSDWRSTVESEEGVKFAPSLEEVPKSGKPTMALISGRTADNPRLLTECIGERVLWSEANRPYRHY